MYLKSNLLFTKWRICTLGLIVVGGSTVPMQGKVTECERESCLPEKNRGSECDGEFFKPIPLHLCWILVNLWGYVTIVRLNFYIRGAIISSLVAMLI